MKIIVLLLALAIPGMCQEHGSSQFGDQFPDKHESIEPSLFGGWHHDRSADFRSHIFTKKFTIAHLIALGSIPFDVEMTQHCIARGTCVEGNGEARREGRVGMYTNNLIPFAVLTGFDILVQWGHPPKAFKWLPYLAPVYGTVIHVRGGLKGIKYY